MGGNAEARMLAMIAKGKHPGPGDLGMGREEFVRLVADAVSDGLIEGVYVSFCDSQDPQEILSSAALTDKGRAAVSPSFLSRLQKLLPKL